LPTNQARLDEVIGGTRVRALRGLSLLAADDMRAQQSAMAQQ
jgi:hypothetical protein